MTKLAGGVVGNAGWLLAYPGFECGTSLIQFLGTVSPHVCGLIVYLVCGAYEFRQVNIWGTCSERLRVSSKL
jgi:hypothetical protein